MTRFAAAAVLLAAPALAAPVPRPAVVIDPARPNTNAVLKRFAGRLTTAASTEYQGWGVGKAFDGDPNTSWFTNGGDAPMAGTKPWAVVKFPEAATVRRVTALGNREPEYPAGYSVTAGTIELLDADGKVLFSRPLKATGDKHDLTLVPPAAVGGVRAVRVTATEDQKQYNCVGLAELQVE
jgi:F5/8 type C domain